MIVCYLGIGSNLGNRRANLKLAIRKLKALKGIQLIKTSKIIETNPLGGPPKQNKFLNLVLKLKTSIPPVILLKKIKIIEKELGRKKTVRFGPRIIDLDILFYGDRVINRKNLIVPHPRIFEREFVVKPLLEVI